MDNTANEYLDPEDKGPGTVDSDQLDSERLDHEYGQEGSEPSQTDKHHFRSMKHRQRRRSKSKPTRPSTYIGQRGNRHGRKSPRED